MGNQQFLLDAFTTYYNNGMNAQKKNNIPLAKKNFKKAAEVLLKLAKMSSGEIKKSRFEKAKRLIEYMENLSETKVVNNKMSSKDATDKENSTETIWEKVKVPNVTFDDIAGLNEVKEAIRNRLILPRKYPEIYEKYRKKVGGGVLMYGLPGTGKTMIAKAIAREIDAAFFSVKSSDIVSKWFGEAEKNVRNLFETARKEGNAVIFFDEFEALGAKRGSSSSVMSRLIPELLAQIQGFEESDANVLILAATNRPWDLDSAFLRPGRFDEKLYIPLPDKPAREFIINKALKDLPLNEDVRIEDLVHYTDGFNAADIVEFCERLKDGPIRRTIEKGGVLENITLDDVSYAKEKVKSSVNPDDLKALEKWQKQFAS